MEIGVYREPSVPTRKRAGLTRQAFDSPKKTEFLAVGMMSGGPDRGRMLRERFRSELVAVRGLLQKAAETRPPSSSPAPSAPRARAKDGRRFLAAAEPRSEEPPAKRRKASPLPPVVKKTEAPKKVTPVEREDLAADLAEFSAELPAHVIEFLQKQNHVFRGCEIEIDLHAMEGAAVLELQKQLDKFVQQRNHGPGSGGVIHGPSPAQQRQDVKIVEEEEQEKGFDIVGGVSPLVIAPPPLQLAEGDDEYVDICGDPSLAVMPQNHGEDETRGSPSHSDSESDNGSSGNDCSDSDSDTDGSSDESVSSPASPEPPPEVVENAEALERRRRQEEREQARQKLVEMERTAMGGTNSIHPMVLQRLGIAQNQYMVCPASCLRRLGLFLKADDDDGGGGEEDLEDGEILL